MRLLFVALLSVSLFSCGCEFSRPSTRADAGGAHEDGGGEDGIPITLEAYNSTTVPLTLRTVATVGSDTPVDRTDVVAPGDRLALGALSVPRGQGLVVTATNVTTQQVGETGVGVVSSPMLCTVSTVLQHGLVFVGSGCRTPTP